MPLEEAVHPRVLRETEAPLEPELMVWVPVSMNVLLWALCTAYWASVCCVSACISVDTYVRPPGICAVLYT